MGRCPLWANCYSIAVPRRPSPVTRIFRRWHMAALNCFQSRQVCGYSNIVPLNGKETAKCFAKLQLANQICMHSTNNSQRSSTAADVSMLSKKQRLSRNVFDSKISFDCFFLFFFFVGVSRILIILKHV